MKKDDIKKLLPHREPMLLLDEVVLDGGKSKAKYTVRGDEFFLQGHYPDNPIVPGVILCEMMAQSSCVLIKTEDGAVPYFTGMNKVRFRGKVLPGDTVEFESELIKSKGAFYWVASRGCVNGKLCVEGELSVAVVVPAKE